MTSSPIDCLPEEGRALSERLHRQMSFIVEVEKLKAVRRQSLTLDALRPENSAEHSWHVALMAAVLFEHADLEGVDLLRVIKMLLIHDIVEIDSGDTFLYDEAANTSKAKREHDCAERVFGLLPPDQRETFTALWREFEARETPEAKVAASVDSLHPLVSHLVTGGAGIMKHGVRTVQVIEKKKHIENASKSLWEYAKCAIREGEKRTFYRSE